MTPIRLPGEESRPALDIELFQELLESLGNELEAVARIYSRFIDSATSKVEMSLGQSATERATTLHALKGSAAMVGAARIAALSERLQENLVGLPGEAAEAAIREIEAELTTFRHALATHLESLGYST